MIKLIYFKVVFTTQIAYYYVDTTWTPSELYINLKPLIFIDFGIQYFELADTVTPYDGKSEEKPKIEPVNYITLEQLYGNNINNLAIYIRPIINN